jgi:hypothetical protein
VGVDGRVGSSAVVGRGGRRSRVVCLDNGDKGGGRTSSVVARDGDGLGNSNDGGLGDGVSGLGRLRGDGGGDLVVVLGLRGLVLGLLGTLDLEGERVLENLGVALELEDETVDVLGSEGGVNGPAVGSSVVVNAS